MAATGADEKKEVITELLQQPTEGGGEGAHNSHWQLKEEEESL